MQVLSLPGAIHMLPVQKTVHQIICAVLKPSLAHICLEMQETIEKRDAKGKLLPEMVRLLTRFLGLRSEPSPGL